MPEYHVRDIHASLSGPVEGSSQFYSKCDSIPIQVWTDHNDNTLSVLKTVKKIIQNKDGLTAIM